MALTARQQACLDNYLASFTPNIYAEIDDLHDIAYEIDDLSKDYTKALDEIQQLRKDLDENLDALIKRETHDDGEPMADADKIKGIREILEDFVGELDGVFADAPHPAWKSLQQPLEEVRDRVIEIKDRLEAPARILDEQAGRVGHVA